mgnify:CR=1 FL=1
MKISADFEDRFRRWDEKQKEADDDDDDDDVNGKDEKGNYYV